MSKVNSEIIFWKIWKFLLIYLLIWKPRKTGLESPTRPGNTSTGQNTINSSAYYRKSVSKQRLNTRNCKSVSKQRLNTPNRDARIRKDWPEVAKLWLTYAQRQLTLFSLVLLHLWSPCTHKQHGGVLGMHKYVKYTLEIIVFCLVEVFPGLVELYNRDFRGFQISKYFSINFQIFQKIIF